MAAKRTRRFTILASKDGGFYWHIQSKNNRIVCASQVYETREACLKAAEWVRDKAYSAEVLDHSHMPS